MVLFDQLRISEDGKKMFINLHVNKADYFKDIYLDTITIMTSDKVLETDPYSPTDNYIYQKTFEDGVKEYNDVLTAVDFNGSYTLSNMSNTLFFVYVKVKGTPDECTPCALDKEITVGVTFDDSLLYQQVMGFTKQLAADCTIPTGFSDFILQWNAFKASVETEHYIPAVKFYNMMFGNLATNYSANSTNQYYREVRRRCGCYG